MYRVIRNLQNKVLQLCVIIIMLESTLVQVNARKYLCNQFAQSIYTTEPNASTLLTFVAFRQAEQQADTAAVRTLQHPMEAVGTREMHRCNHSAAVAAAAADTAANDLSWHTCGNAVIITQNTEDACAAHTRLHRMWGMNGEEQEQEQEQEQGGSLPLQ